VIDRKTVIKLVIGVVLILGLAAASGLLLREPITLWGGAFVHRFGLVGLLAGVVISDSSLLPLTNEPLVLLAISGGLSPWVVFAVTAGGSFLAGPLGWFYGYTLARRTRFGAWLALKNPNVTALLHRYGIRFVAVSALLPFPFSVSTWLAGAAGLPLRAVAAASLLRIVKTAFYVVLIVSGWAVGAS